MVSYSGGKGIRGPQNTGFILGKKSYIDLAKRNLICFSVGFVAETTIRLNESRFRLVLSNLFNISIKDETTLKVEAINGGFDFKNIISVSYTHLTLPTKRIV